MNESIGEELLSKYRKVKISGLLHHLYKPTRSNIKKCFSQYVSTTKLDDNNIGVLRLYFNDAKIIEQITHHEFNEINYNWEDLFKPVEKLLNSKNIPNMEKSGVFQLTELLLEFDIKIRKEQIKKNDELALFDIDEYYEGFPEESKKDPHAYLVKKSAEYHYEKKGEITPLFIHKNQLDDCEKWNNWAFSIIVLLSNSIKIEHDNIQGEDHFLLKINLEDENYGIYNNMGKKFLLEYFNAKDKTDLLDSFSRTLNDYLKAPKNPVFEERGLLPLRWASGGILPIVNYQNKDWVVCFFRDISPVGWNIANGASEDRNEHYSINKLIYREFSEEVNLFSSNPYLELNQFIIQKQFYNSNLVDETALNNKSFYNKQHSLRIEQDQLHLRFSDELRDRVRVKILETPFSIRVGKNRIEEDVLFSINPHEFGIEVVRVLKFNMDDSNYILDGEIHESNNFLLRRPVLLIDKEYLKKTYDENGSIGEFTDDERCFDGKKISFPKECFKIFNADIKSKKDRLSKIKNHNSVEKEFHENWLNNFEELFENVVTKEGDSINNINTQYPLNMLCPVTWKSIEMAIERGVI